MILYKILPAISIGLVARYQVRFPLTVIDFALPALSYLGDSMVKHVAIWMGTETEVWKQ